MVRLIDADKLHEIINFTAFKPPFSKKAIHRYIDDTSTVDAVPVIRCKYCKHYKEEIKCVGGHYSGCDWWIDEGNEIPVSEDGYCSYAERKE